MEARSGIAPDAETPLTVLRGLGPKRAGVLAREFGLRTLGDLVRFLPLRYQEPAGDRLLAEVGEGERVRVRVEVRSVSLWRRGGRSTLQARIADRSGEATAVWFNMPWLRDSLPAGRRLILEGRASVRRGRRIYGPRIVPAEEAAGGGGLRPVYPEAPGVGPHLLRRWVAEALERLRPIPDPLPAWLRREAGVPDLDRALADLHAPSSSAPVEAARRRLAWEEVLTLERRRLRSLAGPAAPPGRAADPEVWRRIEARLPFPLSEDQRRVLAVLRADLAAGRRLTRLLHGEVGSGKTAVAFALMLAVVAEGRQAALLAPTEILARQHLATFRAWLAGSRVELVGLLGDDGAADRRAALAALAEGRASIAIGTHALFGPAVAFRDLGLVVFDEQHRFGVRQKAALIGKGRRPHVLTMTATPIPRTLAWARYGALEPCVLRSRPGTGGGVRTRLAPPGEWPEFAAGLRPALERGERMFVVVPRVDGPDGLLARAADLLAGPWRGLPAAVVHGRLPGAEVERRVARFAAGEAPVLLGTTVVEVGLDVPGVPRMAVLGAERLGLASLHQLRGRLARGPQAGPGECVLFAAVEAHDRLRILVERSDGFAVAEADLARRGPGALRGTSQHGRADFQVFDPLRDADLLDLLRRPKVRSWLERCD
ncbi:MAG: DEAD/DEAH box helicase [Planctomycetota bacterium]|nr:MAG: DEAD/DEAH box helicase [Planctomycetota bacterium]